ncbi:hypothetical protein BZG36_01785 [Bifiguratus adelaidae]|uniref:Mid2 domain-containing protein n=1 Tax=Bifiguratus adelaidae TaxID=1938954 RepID=A0A261Y287_9FUNG|nr:hypothetical protein BZG36_01785 [Bifiguratus adelaidae]
MRSVLLIALVLCLLLSCVEARRREKRSLDLGDAVSVLADTKKSSTSTLHPSSTKSQHYTTTNHASGASTVFVTHAEASATHASSTKHHSSSSTTNHKASSTQGGLLAPILTGTQPPKSSATRLVTASSPHSSHSSIHQVSTSSREASPSSAFQTWLSSSHHPSSSEHGRSESATPTHSLHLSTITMLPTATDSGANGTDSITSTPTGTQIPSSFNATTSSSESTSTSTQSSVNATSTTSTLSSTSTSTSSTMTKTAAETTTTAYSSYSYQPLTWLPSSLNLGDASTATASAAGASTTSASAGTIANNQDLPQYITPFVNVNIPPQSADVAMRLHTISYAKLVSDPVLAAQVINWFPTTIAQTVGCDPSNVIVLSISSAASPVTNAIAKRATTDSGIVVNFVLPQADVTMLQSSVTNPSSSLYSSSSGQLGQYVDSSYFVTQSLAASNAGGSSSGSSGSVQNPNYIPSQPTSSGSSGQSSKPTNGLIIGVAVAGCTVLYAGLTVVVVRTIRKRKAQRMAAVHRQQNMVAQSISAPIMTENSLGWGQGW